MGDELIKALGKGDYEKILHEKILKRKKTVFFQRKGDYEFLGDELCGEILKQKLVRIGSHAVSHPFGEG